METYKSLACPALSHFLACLTFPLPRSHLGSVAGRVDEAFLSLSSQLPDGSHASVQGSAVSLAPRGSCSPQTCCGPLMPTSACLPTGTAELCGHGRRWVLPSTQGSLIHPSYTHAAGEGPVGSVAPGSQGSCPCRRATKPLAPSMYAQPHLSGKGF